MTAQRPVVTEIGPDDGMEQPAAIPPGHAGTSPQEVANGQGSASTITDADIERQKSFDKAMDSASTSPSAEIMGEIKLMITECADSCSFGAKDGKLLALANVRLLELADRIDARVAEAVEREREAIEKLAEGSHLIGGKNPIGALYGVGWDSAVRHIAAAIRERKP